MKIFSDYDNCYDFLTPEEKQKVEAIITGNNYTQYARLYDDGVRIPVFWNPGKEDLMEIIMHKANIINKVGVDLFYEDQASELGFLRILCKKCRFIQVKGEE